MGKTVNIKDLREKGDIVLVVFKRWNCSSINSAGDCGKACGVQRAHTGLYQP